MMYRFRQVWSETARWVKFDLWSAKWLGSVRVVNFEMAIGLVQWFSFAAMLGPYLKVVTLGSKSNRYAFPKLECDWTVVYFAAQFLGFTKSIHTALTVYIYNFLR